MSDYEFDLPLPKQQKTLLLNLVKGAKKCEVMTVHFFMHTPDGFLYHLDFPFTEKEEIQIQMSENPIPGYEVLGLVKYDEAKQLVYLTPKAFKWANYESKSWFGKFWARQSLKDIMLGVAFVLSLILTVFQVIEISQKIGIAALP